MAYLRSDESCQVTEGIKAALKIIPAHLARELQAPDRLMKNPFAPPFPIISLNVKAEYQTSTSVPRMAQS
jgi:hypothetical protein